jgi:Zinc carboxypeptidase
LKTLSTVPVSFTSTFRSVCGVKHGLHKPTVVSASTRTATLATNGGVSLHTQLLNLLIPALDYFTEGGSSTDPCSLTFAGPAPWSEVEVRNVADYYVTVAKDVVIYLAFHSHGKYLLFPLGTDSPPVANFDHLTAIGKAAGDALAVRFGTVYAVGNSKDVLCK